MAARAYTIKVPCSTSNIGPGFDVLGMTLDLHLTMEVVLCDSAQAGCNTLADGALPFKFSYSGLGADSVPLDSTNLILTVASRTGRGRPLPLESLHVHNEIPLARGLGSSGAAVVAGVLLADTALGLGLTSHERVDACLVFEHHPDNVTAALLGGLIASCVGVDPDSPPDAPILTSQSIVEFPVAREIKAVTIIPQFELSTEKARGLLPEKYDRSACVFNLQRLAVLLSALGQSPPVPAVIHSAMQDRLHQQYRQHLVPGLQDILALNYKTLPGLLGTCISGAGPTVLALASDNFEAIGSAVVSIFEKHNVKAEYKVLAITTSGSSVVEKTTR